MTLESPHSPPSHSEASAAPVEDPSPRAMITKGCETNNIDLVSRGLQAAFTKDARKDQELLSWSLLEALWQGDSDIMRYLLEQESAPIDIHPILVSRSASIPVLQVLFDHGWDINQTSTDGGFRGQGLLQLVCGNEALVHWCLDRGATVEDRHTDPYINLPLLERVAQHGTVDTFALLRSRGAQLTPRMLHRAAGAAASCKDGERLTIRMAMVKYLMDDLGIDINTMDTEGQMPNHWGTPLCYAAQPPRGGVDVVRFLLDRGADPFIKDCWGIHDAFGVAKHSGNAEISELLRTRTVQKGQKG